MPKSPVSLYELQAALTGIAPLTGAAEWDNAGWILRPPGRRPVSLVLLCIDLTPAVAAEAAALRAQAVVAYHPPLFQPIRALDAAVHTHRALLACAGVEIAVYSPHTALDAAPGGLNDWLAEQCGPGSCGTSEGTSARVLSLDHATPLGAVADALRERLRLPYVRLALPRGWTRSRPIRRLAVCAGAGASALRGLEVDAWVTGEVSHHDALAAVEGGVAILHSEHARTERPYLPLFARRLRRALGLGVQIRVSRQDRDFHRLG